MKPRIVVLGLSGLSEDLLHGLGRAGWLPNLEDLLGRGKLFPLDDLVPPFVDAEWTALLAGADPGTTGFLEGSRKKDGSYFSEKVSVAAFEQLSGSLLMSRPEEEALFLDVPLGGVLGEANDRDDAVRVVIKNGKGLWSEELFSVPLERSEVPPEKSSGRDSLEDSHVFIEAMTHKTILQGLALSRFSGKSSPGLVVAAFGGLDRILSRFYREIRLLSQGFERPGLKEPLRLFFRVLDDAVGRVLSGCRKDTLFLLVSGHGYGPLKKSLNLNAFLASRQFLAFRQSGPRNALLHRVVSPLLRGMGVRREPIRKILDRIGLGRVAERAGEPLSSEIGHIDWARTRAFALTRTGIYLNMRGTNPRGTLRPGTEARALGEDIIRSLKGLLDPETCQPVIRDVRWREHLYDGPRTGELPHLIVSEWDPSYKMGDWRMPEPEGEVFCDPRGRTGSPVRPGFLCLSGTLPGFSFPSPLSMARIAPGIRRILDRETAVFPPDNPPSSFLSESV